MATIHAVLVHNFFKPKKDPVSVLSLIIQCVCFTYWNHLELLITENDGQKWIIGAVYPCVRRVKFEDWEKQLKREYKIMQIVSTRSDAEMIDIAKALIGLNYDVGSLLFYLPLYLAGRVWLGRKSAKADGALFCYEYIGFIAGWPDYYKITPNLAFKHLKEL